MDSIGESLSQLESNPVLADVLDQSIVGTYVIQDDRFVYVNGTFADWFGYAPDEIIDDKSPLDLTAPKDRDRVREKIESRMDGREVSLRYTFTALRKDGSTFEADVHGTISTYGDRPAIIGTLRRADRSNRAEKVIEELAWGVANHTGKAFYRLLVVHLASCLNLEFAFIGEYEPDAGGVETLSFYNDGTLDDDYEYPVDHPACQEILRSDSTRYENGKLDFPNDDFFQAFDGEAFFGTTLINSVGEVVGLIWVMSRSPFDDPELIRDVLHIFADRAGAEIERARTDTERRVTEEKYRLVFNSVKDGIVVLDSLDGTVLDANDPCCEMFGMDREELTGSNVKSLLVNPSEISVRSLLENARESGNGSQKKYELQFESSSGESFWGEVSLNRVDFGPDRRVLAVVRDVNLRVKTDEAFTNPAPLDPMTDAPSRSYFYHELESSLEKPTENRSTAVLFLDIDNYKKVNNTFGREIGDRVLNDITRRMQSRLGDKGIISRWGGDEYVVLLPEVLDVPNTESVARELLDIFESPVDVAGEQFHLTASLGLGMYPDHAEDTGELVSNAELAMFKAKEKTGNTYRVFTEEASRTVRNQFRLESELREALEKNQFEVHYQPQFDLAGGTVTGAEALIRWRHPEKGFLEPQEFIPLAESRGFIERIDEMVLGEASDAMESLNRDYDRSMRLSVNVSPNHFTEPHLHEIVRTSLSASGLAPEQLVLEITETVAMKDVEFTSKLLNELKQLGIRIALDDFGTGYASFSSLSRLPIDVLKIDRSLVSLIGSREEEFEVIKIIRPLAEELGLKVIAEGIETENQLQLLRDWHCSEGQGFLFCRPLPNLAFQQFIESEVTLGESLDRSFSGVET